jgi:hypothetical protein
MCGTHDAPVYRIVIGAPIGQEDVMRRLARYSRVLVWGAMLVALSASPAAALHDCAFQDVNDDGAFEPGDIVVLTHDWIGKTITLRHPFVVPVGCDHAYVASIGRTHVKATKIVFEGKLEVFVRSSSPIVLEANPDAIAGAGLGDGSVTITGKLHSGGQSGQALFPDHVAGNEALHNRAITIVARGRTFPAAPGTCVFSRADVSVEYPGGSNDIGVHCNGDMVIRRSAFTAARINMQSLNGTIDARSTGASAFVTLGESCDDPARNKVPGKGNDNGLVDAADFPCILDLGGLYPGTTTFASKDALHMFCDIPAGPNAFTAFNDPLIMIAGQTLDLRGHVAPGGSGDTLLAGKYRVTLAAVGGDVLLQNTQINHGPVPYPGGAVITLASRPATANRLDNDAEDFYGPFTGGVYDVTSACLKSGQKVRYGDLAAALVGAPDAAPCKQVPADFQPMANITHAP